MMDGRPMSPCSILLCASRYEASNRREKPHMTFRCGLFLASATTSRHCPGVSKIKTVPGRNMSTDHIDVGGQGLLAQNVQVFAHRLDGLFGVNRSRSADYSGIEPGVLQYL